MHSSLTIGVVLASAVGWSTLGCSAGAPPWPSSASSDAGAGPDALPSASAGSAGMAQGAGGAAGAAGAPGASEGSGAAGSLPLADAGTTPGQTCRQSLPVVAEPPTVLVVADRSGSMFNPLNEAGGSAWTELRATVLALTLALQNEVRFGFIAYAGDELVCPELSSLPPALGNHAAIQALYNSFEAALQRNGGPFGALTEAQSVLSSAPGGRHVWLVTDGDVDYCDNGNPLCPVDSAIGHVQRLAAATPAIRTTLFGAAVPTSPLPSSALAGLANAGAGLPVALPLTGPTPTDTNAIFDQCSSVPGWVTDFATTGKPSTRGQSVGDYSGSAGGAVVHAPTSDVTALLAELRSGLVNERGCSFDLAAEGVPADALASDSLVLEIDAAPVARDGQNGWQLVDGSTLRLEGASCSALRATEQVPQLELRWACTR